ncbi:tripartite tricarboxylate transporter substrate binding protein [Achromobacter sp. GG226]|uniref:tripartite tricarboxylate transporter substrate binding protein n=1 Tax=Verticiella alkaliphila TaxID=2779529 RepID=UPI001C0DB7D1|nr:tripartite tricarboxylate transporter substrate binding protein [Verticiella sp. GG226]MBU4612365.1 tripartite tricarboxylate transporter substrate binding protein [Verticiella sp. GG226]
MFTSLRRAAVLAVALGAGLGLTPAAQAAQAAFPERPITIVVPFPAGGSIDALLRGLSPAIGAKLGQNVLIENAGGAGGAIGAAKVAQATPDGYTLLAGSINDIVMQPTLNTGLRYRTSDLEPITLVAISPVVLVARPGLPANTFDELVDALRKAPDSLSYGSPGHGTFQHVIVEELQRRTDTKMLHVPYKGAAPLINDLLGGQIDIAVMAPPTALPHVQQGRLKSLGVVSSKRMTEYPDMPTVNEGKSVKDFDMPGWIGILAPQGVPQERLDRVRDAFAQVLASDEARKRVLSMGMETVTTPDRASFAERIDTDVAGLRALNLQLQP